MLTKINKLPNQENPNERRYTSVFYLTARTLNREAHVSGRIKLQ